MSAPSLREQINIRLTETGKTILYNLQDHHGISQAAVIEQLLRNEARKLGWDDFTTLKRPVHATQPKQPAKAAKKK